MKTKQEVFDTVVTHLLTQNEKSVNSEPGPDVGESLDICVYRGPRGLKCAVGCLISDEAYTVKMENHTPHYGTVRKALRASGYEVEVEASALDLDRTTFLAMYGMLQDIHDTRPVREWFSRLQDLGQELGLEFNPPKGAPA